MTLSHRAEAAAPDEARGLLDALFEASDQTLRWPIDRIEQWNALLDINTPEAHLAAAMMLVPEGCVWSVQTDFGLPGRARLWGSVLPGQIQDCGWSADGATPALALIAAIARSQGQ